MAETKPYEVDGLEAEFTPNGSPFEGLLTITAEREAFCSHVNLTKTRSRSAFVGEMSELCGTDVKRLKRALNDILILRTEEIAAAEAGAGKGEDGPEALPPVADEEVDELVGRSGVLERYADHAALIHGVVGERPVIKVQALVAFGAQLALSPNGRPAGANLVITAPPGRGKNYLCDAVASLLPEGFYLAYESASAKSLYYMAEKDPTILMNRWIYPNEAEAADLLVEMFRPLISGGKASHLTVNKDADGRNAAQELNVQGPVTITIPTVRNNLDVQLQTRMLIAELPDYEGRVAAHSLATSRLLLPSYAAEDHGPTVRAWQAALKSLTGVRRVVLDLDHDAFCFDSDRVPHGARLWGNLLGLMLAHAWLEQRNREVKELPSGELAVFATPEDYKAAYRIFKATCKRSVVDLSDTHRKILNAVWELRAQDPSSGGFSQRQISDKAGVHHSTIGQHKAFLVKSAKLLREMEGGGLTLVADAEPEWWRREDGLLAGFPRPEQVQSWWEEKNLGPAEESARHSRHSQDNAHDTDSHALNGGGLPDRHRPDTARHHNGDNATEGVAGSGGVVASVTPASKNSAAKPKTA